MAMVPIGRIVVRDNARTVTVSQEADDGLRRSIEMLGVLQPLLLRPQAADVALYGEKATFWDEGPRRQFELVLGGRRFRCVAALGLTEVLADIRVMSDAEVEAAQLAENLQREAMHPADQWRGVKRLVVDGGMSIEQAAGALGLSERATRRMELLGKLDPALLALAEIDMPSVFQLRAVATAPRKLQAQAAKKGGKITEFDGTVQVNWNAIAQVCRIERIPRAAAIFDVDADKHLHWDEDLFAEPGADDQFTTPDIDGFMSRQRKALEARVAELAKNKKRHKVATMGNTGISLAAGFQRVYDGNPQRLRKHETAFHAIAPNGVVTVCVGLDGKAAKAELKEKEKAAKGETRLPASEDADDREEGAPEETAAKPPISKVGLALIATAKDEALRKALDETPREAADVLALLLLALSADNVRVETLGTPRYLPLFDDLAARMLAPGGNPLELSASDICAMGKAAIGRILRFSGPHASPGATSGDAAEWVGAAINARDHLPRFDTAAFLETVTLPELKRAALSASLKPTGTATRLRQVLAGQAPNWRPESADFGAPAPKGGNDVG